MVEGREPRSPQLSETAAHALGYWYVCFAWLVVLELDRSAIALLFGRTPEYDEWTTLTGFVLSMLLLLLVLVVPVLLVLGGWVLYRVSHNPCPWEPSSGDAVTRRPVYVGLVSFPVGVGALLTPDYMPMLWQRLAFIACLIAVDFALWWWARRASPSSRLRIRLGEVRRIK